MTDPQTSRRYGVPLATYRLQLHPGFGFAEAAEVVPYLARLGVSHLYLSPFFAATPGSTHGYDTQDHSRINPELGGREGLEALGAVLREHDMGLMADIVPNHVGVTSNENEWWQDVMRLGQNSPYASYFDIDWEGQPQVPPGLLTFPILGAPYGQCLERGELRLVCEDNEVWLRYYDNRLPLAPHTCQTILEPVLQAAAGRSNDAALFVETQSLLEALGREEAEFVHREVDRLRVLLGGESLPFDQVEERLAQLNGTPGDPDSFDDLDAILGMQHYRLRDWRTSGDEINYRRFFDINGLAAIRVERPEVFEDVHRLLFELVEADIVTAVRIDHVDGLYDPAGYLLALRERLDAVRRSEHPVPVYVEKILAPGENLPAWPVEGTTGYDFIGQVEGLFVRADTVSSLSRSYNRFVAEPADFEETAREARDFVADLSFAGETSVISHRLYRIAQQDRATRDLTLLGIRRALVGVLSHFPVYRTYMAPGSDIEVESGYVHQAITAAREDDPYLSVAALELIESVLLTPPDSDNFLLHHVQRQIQQLSSPVMAKGIEDTTFYRYVRHLALNEVGGAPEHFSRSPDEVHEWLAARQSAWPSAMSASSTHDTKRNEYARARLLAISEFADEWWRLVRDAGRLHHRLRRPIGDEDHPGAVAEYYLYQVIAATWTEADADDPGYVERIREHMVKALREAKLESSWVRPNEQVEQLVQQFVEQVLDSGSSPGFARRLRAFVAAIKPVAEMNALAMSWLKCFAPGFPDIYQGTEVPEYRLTDPDNRAPVDFALRRALLERVEHASGPGELEDGASRKMWYTRKALSLRNEHHDVFACGGYEALGVQGPLASNYFAFARQFEGKVAVVGVPLLTRALNPNEGKIDPAEWVDTAISLPPNVESWTDGLTGREGVASTQLRDLLGSSPLLLLHGDAR